ncbi:hypothetical protein ACH4D5_11075 [Streptomyces sp. NPDC018029]|uniref:hypothetical protein n=1 Tax=Streptomyces sp. NPDC018029 TaxID=3365032 RepID=UPI0037BA9A2B
MRIGSFVGFAVLATLATSCAPAGSTESSAETCDIKKFEWDITKKWRLVVLDEPLPVRPNVRFEMRAEPYEPVVAELTGANKAVSESDISTALLEEARKDLPGIGGLAKRGSKTTAEARKMSAKFNNRAQVVYYRGLRTIEASYHVSCVGNNSLDSRGHVFTWDTHSPTTGLIDCLASPKDNANSVLAKSAVRKRCPKNSPATGA